MRIPREVYNYLNFELGQYKRYKSELEELRTDILESTKKSKPLRNKRKKDHPDQEPEICLNTCAGIVALEKTVRNIEEVLEDLTSMHRALFKEVYIKKREDFESVAIEMNISIETFRRRRKDIIVAFGITCGALKQLN